MTSRILFFSLLSVHVLLTSAALKAQHKYQGLLWEISGNGLHQPSYLYGTMHVSSKLAFNLGSPFFTALNSVDQVALEMDPELWFDEVLGGDFMSQAMNNAGNRFNPYAGKSSWNDFQGKMSFDKSTNQQLKDAFKSSPEMINQLLFRFYDQSGNFEEDTWLDMFIYQSAKKLGKKTLGLETFYESMEMMKKAQEEMVKHPDKQSDLDYQMRIKAISDIEESYRTGNLDLLDSLSTLVNSSSFTKYILIERNKNFVRGIDSLMHKHSMFIGVGAAHLPGEEGCIKMLREKGYTVNPVAAGSRDTKTKDKLTELIIKRPLRTYTSADGHISFSTPTETYSIAIDSKSIGYVSMDITNGLTFSLTRILTDNALKQRSPEAQLMSFDSLLYESIPGDLLKKKRISFQGYPSYDIIHRVGRGDVNRSMIIFTDHEVILARLSASGEKISRGAGDHFFSTLKLNLDKSSDWRNVQSPYKIFQADFNGRFTCYGLTKEKSNVTDLYAQSVDAQGDVYMLHRLQANQGGYIEDQSYLLYKADMAFQKDFNVKELSHAQHQIDDRSILDVSYTNYIGKKVSGRYVVSEDQVYALHIFSNDTIKIKRFLNSLQLGLPKYESYYGYTDSSAFISSKLPWVKTYSKLDKLMNDDPYDDPENEGNSEYYYTSTLTAPGSKDQITLHYYRYPSYFSITDREEHEKELDEDFSDEDDSVIEFKDFHWNDKGYEADYILGDSLSDMKYAIHRILDGNRLFTVTAGYDVKLGMSELYTEFVKHVSLLEDSMDTGSLLALNKELFMNDLMSADTLKFKNANNSLLNNSSFPEEFEYEIFTSLRNEAPPLATEKDKKKYETKFNKLRYLAGTDSMLTVLEEDFLAHEDSALFQREILGTMVHFKTKKAVLKAKELLTKDAPIGIHTSLYDTFFSSLGDSLELSAHFFPELLELVDYDEYKNPVLLTLNLLLDSAALDKKAYVHKLPYLLKQTKQETKRLNSTGHEFELDEDSEFYREMVIHHYWNLLYPFKEMSQVKEVYHMAETASLKELQKSFHYFKLKKGEEIPDAACLALTEGKDFLKDQLFLHAMKRPELFPDSIDLVQLYLKEHIKKQWRSGSNDWDNSVIDSILFVSQRTDSIRTHAFNTYYIKSLLTKDGSSDWQMHVVMVDKSSKVPELDYLKSTDVYSRNTTEQEQFEEMRNILIANNRRYPNRSYEDEDFY